jgi:hypothetical protein
VHARAAARHALVLTRFSIQPLRALSSFFRGGFWLGGCRASRDTRGGEFATHVPSPHYRSRKCDAITRAMLLLLCRRVSYTAIKRDSSVAMFNYLKYVLVLEIFYMKNTFIYR